jgi:hypothetical protein
MSSASIPVVSRHSMKYPIIVDSGVNYHMCKEKDFLVLLHLQEVMLYLAMERLSWIFKAMVQSGVLLVIIPISLKMSVMYRILLNQSTVCSCILGNLIMGYIHPLKMG